MPNILHIVRTSSYQYLPKQRKKWIQDSEAVFYALKLSNLNYKHLYNQFYNKDRIIYEFQEVLENACHGKKKKEKDP